MERPLESPPLCSSHAGLVSGFLQSAVNYSTRPALSIEGREVSYDELARYARRIVNTLGDTRVGEPALTAVFGQRSVTAFAGVLAALMRGHGYVPLSPSFPTRRTLSMLDSAGCRSIIVDEHAFEMLEELLRGCACELVVILPTVEDVEPLRTLFKRHTILGAGDLGASCPAPTPQVSVDDVAYLLFTSGSTGKPKGVMVSHRNVIHFLQSVEDRYDFGPNDRFSQMFSKTFDLSVFDMFCAWDVGACLCCPSNKTMIKPGAYIRNQQLTVWFSVPSTGLLMKKFGELKTGAYPSLRVALFCGEALTAEIAKAWCGAAPNAILENLYGPTELTIACTAYRWNDAISLSESGRGVVPIGEPLPGMKALIVDHTLNEVAVGEPGELIMAGPQCTLGYWQDISRTAKGFIQLQGTDERFYRTGDLVVRKSADAPFEYLGRLDHQVQVNGHRVEIGEVEAIARESDGIDQAVVIGWPPTEIGVSGLVMFILGDDINPTKLRNELKQTLPPYMVPGRYVEVGSFPLNINGKIDRRELLKQLKRSNDGCN